MTRKALITGITGQDGSYLAEFLLAKGYEVHGIVRRVAIEDPEHRLWRINHIAKQLVLHPGSLESYPALYRLVNTIKPDEIYHLAAQSFVSYSFEDEFSILNTNLNGTHNLLSVVRDSAPNARFYFAGSSEMFGDADETPQNEGTRFHPRSVYGVSKVAGFHLTRNYREACGLHASAGILFNHDSPRRGFEFVTRKITSHAAKIKLGLASELRLGNLEARRDWGHAREYVQAMWMMLQQDRPDDYCVATGETHSVREFLEAAFEYVGLDYSQYVVLDPILHRPAEVNVLRGDCSKARERLGWRHSTPLVSLVHRMVDADLEYAERGALNKRVSAR
jgi:GDPmannose 4,6-dehydratase